MLYSYYRIFDEKERTSSLARLLATLRMRAYEHRRLNLEELVKILTYILFLLVVGWMRYSSLGDCEENGVD